MSEIGDEVVFSKTLAEKDGKVIAKGYAVFRWYEDQSRTRFREGFGQKVYRRDGVKYGWHCAYIVLDWDEFEENALLKGKTVDDYPDIDVYGGCTYHRCKLPVSDDDADKVFEGRMARVLGWDYNHGYQRSWADVEESEITISDIEADIDKVWAQLEEGQPKPQAKEDCSLSQWFDRVDVDGRSIYFLRSKDDGSKVLPVLFCPFCGKPLYDKEEPSEEE